MCTESTGCAASFGEMLLLIAINFHAGQLSSIVDLICQTLGNYPQIQHLLTIVKKEVDLVKSRYNYFFFPVLRIQFILLRIQIQDQSWIWTYLFPKDLPIFKQKFSNYFSSSFYVYFYDEPFRDNEIFNNLLFLTVWFGVWEQKVFFYSFWLIFCFLNPDSWKKKKHKMARTNIQWNPKSI